MIADSFDYSTFPGTAIFADGKLVESLSFGGTNGQTYNFGYLMQGSFYNRLAGAEVVTIKVLGAEALRLRFDDPGLWNEMSNCIAQYPSG